MRLLGQYVFKLKLFNLIHFISVCILAVSFNVNAAIDAHVAEHHIDGSDHINHHIVEQSQVLNIHAQDHGHKRVTLEPFHNSEKTLDFFEFIPFKGIVFNFQPSILIEGIQIRLAMLSHTSPPSRFRNLPLLN